MYGPWGRPDMALFLFTRAILNDQPIKVFNHGKMERDFTYIDDIIEGVIRVMANPPKPNKDFDKLNPDPGSSYAPYKLYNIGNNQPITLMELIQTLEKHIGREARKEFLPLQQGDAPRTYANVDELVRNVEFKPDTPIDVGVARFVKWYREFYR